MKDALLNAKDFLMKNKYWPLRPGILEKIFWYIRKYSFVFFFAFYLLIVNSPHNTVFAEVSTEKDPSNNSRSNPDFSVTQTASEEPDISVFPEAINANLFIAEASMQPITIVNTGGSDLHWKVEMVDAVPSDGSFVDISKKKGVVSANTSEIISFYLNTLDLPYGVYKSVLQISSNDPDENPVNIATNGISLNPPIIDISPISIEENLQFSESSNFSVTISNTGGPMNWSIEGAGNNSFLKGILKNLNEKYQMITDLIPNRFNFSGGIKGYRIDNGGNDMYSRGNTIYIDLKRIIYSDNTIVTNFQNIDNESYFTLKKPGLFIFASENIHINTFKIYGNLESDIYDEGLVDACILETRVNNRVFTGFVKRVYNKHIIPSVNHLIIIPKSENANHNYSSYSYSDSHEIFNLSDTNQLYYLLFSGKNGEYINNDTITQIMTAFIQCIDIFPAWLKISKNKGHLDKNNSEILSLQLNASDLMGGFYRTYVMIENNDPFNSIVELPVSLQVTGFPKIELSSNQINFGEIFIGYSETKAFTITNAGSDTLEILSIDVNHSDYYADISNLSLPPGKSQMISITCSPSSPLFKENELIIESNDPDEPSISISLIRSGLLTPEIIIKPDKIECNLPNTSIFSLPLTINNKDSGKLLWQIPENTIMSSIKNATSDNKTIHEFNCGLLDNDIALSLTVYGDFDDSSEYCDIYIENEKIDSLNNAQEMKNNYLKKILLLQSHDIKRWTSDTKLTVELRNSSSVDILPLTNTHLVQLEILFLPYWLSVSENIGELMGNDSDQILLQVNPQNMIAGVYEHSIRIISNDPVYPMIEVPVIATITGEAEVSITPANLLFNDTWIGYSNSKVLTIVNSGTDTLELSAIVTHSAYTVTPNIFKLLPETSQQAIILFSALDVGSSDGEIQFISNDPDERNIFIQINGSASIQVTGIPDIDISTSMLKFDDVWIGNSCQKALTLVNSGSETLLISEITLNHADYTANTQPLVIPPNYSQVLPIAYTPSAIGNSVGNIKLTTNDPDEGNVIISLNGTAVNPPKILISPTEINDTLFSSQANSFLVTISNHGESPLNWSLSNDSCNENQCYEWLILSNDEGSVQSNQSATLVVTLDASHLVKGYYETVLNLLSNDPDNKKIEIPIFLSVEGIPEINLSSKSINLGEIWSGYSYANSITITNSGSDILLISSIITNHSDHIVKTRSLNILPGFSRQLTFISTPSTSRNIADYIQIISNDPDEEILTISLNGTARTAPEISVFPENIHEQLINSQSFTQSISIVNNGGSVLVWNTDPTGILQDWIKLSKHKGMIHPNTSESVIMTISTNDLIEGTYESSIIIQHNDPEKDNYSFPVSIDVSGTPDISLSSNIVDFGTVWIGIPIDHRLTITNAGSAALHISEIHTTHEEYTLTSSSIFLSPGAYQHLTITFLPSLTGSITGEIQIKSNDPDEREVKVLAQGVVKNVPKVSVFPMTINEKLLTSESSVQTITISNNGEEDLLWRIVKKRTLHEQLESLNSKFHIINDLIPNQYVFSGGINGCYIGNSENPYMYEYGNELAVDNKTVCYSNKQIIHSEFLGINGKYFTAKYPGLFIFAADNILIDQFSIYGRLEIQNKQYYDKVECSFLETMVNGNIFQGFVKKVYGKYMHSFPSVNHLMIIPKNRGIQHEFSSDPYSDFHQISNLSKTDILYYLLFSIEDDWYKENNEFMKGGYIPDEYILRIMTSFLKILDLRARWLNVSAYEGNIKPKTSETINVYIDTKDLITEKYVSDIQIHTNDPYNTEISIPVSLSVTGEPDIKLSADELMFGDVWLTYSNSQFITIFNSGSDTLNISAIHANNDDYSVNVSNMNILPDQSQSLAVNFLPLTKGSSFGKLILNTNVYDQRIIEIPIEGTGLRLPGIIVSPVRLDVNINNLAPSTILVTITNTGGSLLEWNLSVTEIYNSEPLPILPSWLKISKTKGLLEKDSLVTIKIDYEALLLKSWYEALNLIIHTNIPDQEPVIIPMNVNHEGYRYIKPCITVIPLEINEAIIYGNLVHKQFTIKNTGSGILQWTITDNLMLLSRKKWIQYTGDDSYYSHTYTTHQFKCGHINEDIRMHITVNGDYDSSGEYCKIYIESSYMDHPQIYTHRKGLGVDIESNYKLSAENVNKWTSDGILDIRVANSENVDSGFGTDEHMVQLIFQKKRPTFLAVSEKQGLLRANESQTITATLHSSKLKADSYQYWMIIQSNDIDRPETISPVFFDIIGEPDISISHNVLEFEHTWMGNSVSKVLTISNAGSDTLHITSITSDHSAYSVHMSVTNIPAGDSSQFPIVFTPDCSGYINSKLRIISNDSGQKEKQILLKGRGIVKPEIRLSPDRINAKLTSGESLNRAITISNTSDTHLSWQLLNEENITPLETILENLNKKYLTIIEKIPGIYYFSEGKTNWFIENGIFSNSSSMSKHIELFDFGNILTTEKGRLNYSDGVIQHNGTLGLTGKYFTNKYPGLFVFAANISNIDTFVISGGLGMDGKGQADGAVLHLNINGIGYTGFVKRVYGTISPSINHLVIIKDSSGTSHELLNDTDNDYHKIFNLSDISRIFYLLYCGNAGEYIDDDSTLTIMKSFIQALDEKQISLNISKTKGDISGFSSETVEMIFHSGTLIEGNYTFDIEIASNDPDHAIMTIPLSLSITGMSAIAVSPTSLDFGNVSVGHSTVDVLNIANPGTETLQIFSISSYHSAYSFTSLLPLEIAPGEIHPLTINFEPKTVETQPDELIISSNAVEHNHLTISLEGKGVIGPILSVSPTAFSETLTSGEITLRNLMITNMGDAPLECMVRSLRHENPQNIGRILNTYYLSTPYNSGMVWVEKELFIIDYKTDQLCKYDKDQYVITQRYNIHLRPFGITWDGSKLWIGDDNGTFYCYHTDGTFTGKSIQSPFVGYSFISWNGTHFIVYGMWEHTIYCLDSMGNIVESYNYDALSSSYELYGLSRVWWMPFTDDGTFWALNPYHMNGISRFSLKDGQFIRKNDYMDINNWDHFTEDFTHDGSDLWIIGKDREIYRVDDGIEESFLSGSPENQIILSGDSLNYAFAINTSKIYAGNYEHHLRIRSNDHNNPDILIPVQLSVTEKSVTPTAEPDISLSTESILLEIMAEQTKTITLTVTNIGGGLLTFDAKSVFEGNVDYIPSYLISVTPLKNTLLPNESTSISIHVDKRSSESRYYAKILITSNDKDESLLTIPFIIKVIGDPGINLSPEKLSFTSAWENYPEIQTVLITNTGFSRLFISKIFCTHPDYIPSFTALEIKPNESKELNIQFKPGMIHSEQSTLYIISNDPNMITSTIILDPGALTSLAPPDISISPFPIIDDNLMVGDFADYTIVIMNTAQEGSGNLIWNIDSCPFDISPTSGTLSPLQSDTIRISINTLNFTTGTYQKNLLFLTNVPGNPEVSIPLELTLFGKPEISISETIDFGETCLGRNEIRTFAISNKGTEVLHISDITSISKDFKVLHSELDCSIQPGETQDIAISCLSASEGNITGKIVLTCNDPQKRTIQVTLSATVIKEPDIDIQPDFIEGTLSDAGMITRTLNISNVSGDDLIWMLTSTPSVDRFKAGQIFEKSYGIRSYNCGIVWVSQHLYVIGGDALFVYDNHHNYENWYELFSDPYGITFDGEQLWVGNRSGLISSYSLDGKPTGLDIFCPFENPPGLCWNADSFIVNDSEALAPIFYQLSKTGQILRKYKSTFERKISQITCGKCDDLSVTIWGVDNDFNKLIQMMLINNQAFAIHEFDIFYSAYSIEHSDSNLWLGYKYGPLYRINDGLRPSNIIFNNNHGSLPANATEVISFSYGSDQLTIANYIENIIITSNDPDEQNIIIPVRYSVYGVPELMLSSEELKFEIIIEGSETESLLTMTNIGTDDLIITDILSQHPDISVEVDSFFIPAGHSHTVKVLLKASQIGPINSTLIIKNNDPSTENTIVKIIGEILADPARPLITLIGQETITIEVNTPFNDQGAIVTDPSGKTRKLDPHEVTSNVNIHIPGIYSIIYQDLSNSLKPALDIKRSVIVRDSISPHIELHGKRVLLVKAKGLFIDPGYSLIDNYDTHSNMTHLVNSKVVHLPTGNLVSDVQTSITGTYELSYIVSDTSGNLSEPVYRYVDVYEETKYTLSGNVVDEFFRPLKDVRVQLTNQQLYYSVLTDESGAFTLTKLLPTKKACFLNFSKQGYETINKAFWGPVSNGNFKNVMMLSLDQTDYNSISGICTFQDKPLQGVKISIFDGNYTQTSLSDFKGFYYIYVKQSANHLTITATKKGYKQITRVAEVSDQINLNFSKETQLFIKSYDTNDHKRFFVNNSVQLCVRAIPEFKGSDIFNDEMVIIPGTPDNSLAYFQGQYTVTHHRYEDFKLIIKADTIKGLDSEYSNIEQVLNFEALSGVAMKKLLDLKAVSTIEILTVTAGKPLMIAGNQQSKTLIKIPGNGLQGVSLPDQVTFHLTEIGPLATVSGITGNVIEILLTDENGKKIGKEKIQERQLHKVFITLGYSSLITAETLLNGIDKIVYADSAGSLFDNVYNEIPKENIISVNDTSIAFQTDHLGAFGFLKETNDIKKMESVGSSDDSRCYISVLKK